MLIDHLDQFITRIYRFQDSNESLGQIQDELYKFLDQNYETYLHSNAEEREEIRKAIRRYYESPGTPNMLDLFLIGYVQRAGENILSTSDRTWLTRGLVVCAMEDSIRDERDNTISLAYLYTTSEEKNLNPRLEFQAIAEIASDEISSGGNISMRELLRSIPDIAQKPTIPGKKNLIRNQYDNSSHTLPHST
jgi:hypothetical protein